jgi:hypothetical protein
MNIVLLEASLRLCFSMPYLYQFQRDDDVEFRGGKIEAVAILMAL